MIKLHLVGFTTDLRNLIFARRRGAEAGNYLLEIDERLLLTLEEVAKLEEEAKAGSISLPLREDAIPPPPEPPPPPPKPSKLSPREIQSLLREGKTTEQVARLADTDVSWVERFTGPIIAERAGIADLAKVQWIAKPRLGKSELKVGEAVEKNLAERHVPIPPEVLDEGWDAVKRDGHWHVTFRYFSRGRTKEATFSFDPATREVKATNPLAYELGWATLGRRREGAADEEGPRHRRAPAPAPRRAASAKKKSRTTRAAGAPPMGGEEAAPTASPSQPKVRLPARSARSTGKGRRTRRTPSGS